MDNRIIELLYRNLQEVFGEGDAARRRAAIRDFYTEDCVLYVPPGVFFGHAALDKFAGDLRATHLTSHIRLTASHSRYTMLAVWRGGPARVERSLITLAWT
jgi:ketosteroid isomerase-like protein